MGPFQSGSTSLKGCTDEDEKCEEWAVMGECERTPCATAVAIVFLAAAACSSLPSCCCLLPIRAGECQYLHGNLAAVLPELCGTGW